MASDETPRPREEGEQTFVRISNQVIYGELQAARADIRALAADVADYPETKDRVRKLELRFYGILAGFISAAALVAGRAGGVL